MMKGIFLLLIFWPVLLSAAVINVPGDYPTIQAGIDAAADGDTVLIADGIYRGDGNRNLDFNGKNIVVASENGPHDCIIDCELQGRGFHFHSGESEEAQLIGLQIINGYVDSGQNGGGVLCESSGLSIIGCVIHQNEAREGGGIYCSTSADATIRNCKITKNFAELWGGGVACLESGPTLIGCTIGENVSHWGGGIYCGQYSSPTIRECEITRNRAPDGTGGGIDCERHSDVSVMDSIVTYNIAESGGGIECFGHADITGCLISNNLLTPA